MIDEDDCTITTQGRAADEACPDADLDIDSLHVVELRFDGTVLTLDGAPVDYGWQPPHELAVRAVALGIARPRGQAVRAFCEDETGTASELLILPDGSSRVIRTCEAPSPGERLPAAAEAALARLAVKRANPWLVGRFEEAPARQPETQPVRGRLRRPALPALTIRREPLARAVAAIALSATVVATAAVAIAVAGGDETTAPVSSAPTMPRAADVTIAGRPVLSAAPRTLRVTAAGGARSLGLTITASRLPVSAVITVDPAGPAAPITRTVLLRKPGARVVLRGIGEGAATWQVRVLDAPPAQGRTRALAEVTPEPIEPTEPPAPSQAPPPPPPSPRPPPPGPTAPYDPDDH